MKVERKILLVIAGLWVGVVCVGGPYPPAVGQDGSTAIEKPTDPNDTSVFVGWADGWTDYIIGTEVGAQWQTPDKALGVAKGTMADHDIVCLGRGGQITLTFSIPIADGPGWDLATFENSMNNTFLELGYVEVSSDGINFFRFDNDSRTPATVGPFGAVDPTNITGYCSKYRQGYGTPFDLADLTGIEELDINAVTHIRIVDIVGDGTYTDTDGDSIYDPYATIGSAGVDLDAIGVIHQKTLTADFNGDGIVNLKDYAQFNDAYLSTPADPQWNYKCDLAPFINEQVDLNDFLVLAVQWLLTEAWYSE